VTPAEKTLRFLELEKVQKQVQTDRAHAMVGKTLKVLVEGTSARSIESFTGHSTCHRVVNFRGEGDLLGNIVDVRITEAKANSLFGEVVN
jgi:tRNA-2-methylthio-N6-dimethylallyladenosine synthase